jgi:hypothetical protein
MAALTERLNVVTWVKGGFAMGIVNGTIKQAGKNYRFTGLGELLI